MRLSEDLSSRVAAAIDALGQDTLPDIIGRQNGALPLWADMGGAILLRPDGAFLELEWDQPSEQHPRVVDTPDWPVALVAGAARYPWLRELLPVRPNDAAPCTDCEGQGQIAYANSSTGQLYCGSCHGLGWRAA